MKGKVSFPEFLARWRTVTWWRVNNNENIMNFYFQTDPAMKGLVDGSGSTECTVRTAQSYQSWSGCVKDDVCGLRQLTLWHLDGLASRGQSQIFVVLKGRSSEGTSTPPTILSNAERHLWRLFNPKVTSPRLSSWTHLNKLSEEGIIGWHVAVIKLSSRWNVPITPLWYVLFCIMEAQQVASNGLCERGYYLPLTWCSWWEQQ